MDESLKNFVINFMSSPKDIGYTLNVNGDRTRMRLDHVLPACPSFIIVFSDPVGEVYIAQPTPPRGDKVCLQETPILYIANQVMALDVMRAITMIFRIHEEADRFLKKNKGQEDA